jgi:hypothetical protein
MAATRLVLLKCAAPYRVQTARSSFTPIRSSRRRPGPQRGSDAVQASSAFLTPARNDGRIVPPERRGLRVIIHEGDDEAAAMEKAVAEHIAAHPEDAGRTVKDFRWVVWEIVRKPQELPQELFEDELTAKDTDEDAAVSETDLNVLTPPDPDYLARSKPWRPVHQRPVRDMRRPTWKKWER